ncbi:probable low affinity copper uptake protein 2 isoform X1 [Nomascus leucogenys]|nr:probable low affinity copper uptake protein 2 isoform X1 [Nomascus leucogenys]XP_030673500.1 probable low affinity copper uptake protein 2 isoform X1 [Nomascus leucogenys]XP_055127397.1 probable low affinity copper uptake protein 2 isoform X1 [Symphalangus syndactylus]XP_055127398.1 probable low affinity copper uptake protein 2 isoform X1 [Symphalangus syndactylus]
MQERGGWSGFHEQVEVLEGKQCWPGPVSTTLPPFTGMALSVLVLLLLAVLYEGIKVGKAKLLNQVLVNLPTSISQQTIAETETDGDSACSDSSPVGRTHHRWYLCHFGQSLIHVIQVVIGYFIMLAVMSYNTWIFLGVVLGSAVGYYLAYPLLSTA